MSYIAPVWADGKAPAITAARLNALCGTVERLDKGNGYVVAGQKSGTTLGEKATAEGTNTTASGVSAHAEGKETVAAGYYSHVEGANNTAYNRSMHVFGEYNSEPLLQPGPESKGTYVEMVGNGEVTRVGDIITIRQSNARTLEWDGTEWIAGTLTQASDARLKDVAGDIPEELSGVRAVRFRWNDNKGTHDDKDHIGYLAQEVETIAPYLVGEDPNGYKSLDYIALLCAKVELLERRVRELERGDGQ